MTKAILFDFDGTLVDSAPGIVKTMEQTFIKMGVTVPSENKMRATIGLPLRLALQQLGNLNEEEADKATETYRELFPTFEVEYIKVFEGVIDTLSLLRDKSIRMAIVTSRDRHSLELVAEKRGLMPFFETCVTGADGFRPKPAPDMVLALLDRMELQPDEALVVGDTTFDIGMGNSASCPTLAVTYGNHTREKLTSENPTFIIDSFGEIIDIISKSKR
ncbi:MAG: HAD family hydrolase [Bacteroidaceae bacterium]|nr:HAD family hydrolase [Bacteroidaceae bacterium]